MKILSRKNKAFTMVELVLSMTIIGLLLPSIFSVYSFILKSNREIVARQDSIQQWYEFFERLNILMEDYTIDYEEYYNRQMVWCTGDDAPNWTNFERNVDEDWYCENFTAYWNGNNIINDTTQHHIYKCSSNIGNSNKVDVKNETICWKVKWQHWSQRKKNLSLMQKIWLEKLFTRRNKE